MPRKNVHATVETKPRWSWKAWLARVALVLSDDAEAQEVAAKVAAEKRGARRPRGFWSHEFGWMWGPGATHVDAALQRLSRAGLLSRCPGAPAYTPTMEPDPYGADYREVPGPVVTDEQVEAIDRMIDEVLPRDDPGVEY